MRIPSRIVAGLASAAVVGIGWQAGWAGITANETASTAATSTTGIGSGTTGTISGTTDAAGGSATSSATESTGSSSSNSGTGSGAGSGTSGASATTTATDGSYTGDAVSTRWGPMQVQVAISGGQIADVSVLQSTGPDRKSVQISSYAEPILRQEVLASQSAHVSGVSGATYTTNGYLQSLQSALDAASFTG